MSTTLSRNGTRQPQVLKSGPVRALDQRSPRRWRAAGRSARRAAASCAKQPTPVRGRPTPWPSAPSRPTRRRRRAPGPMRSSTSRIGAADADRGEARQHADEHRADPHQQQGRDQGRLAADPVAEVAEDRGADGSGGEADDLGRERGQHARERDSTPGRTAAGRPAPRPSRTGRSRTTRSWCRPCSPRRLACAGSASPRRSGCSCRDELPTIGRFQSHWSDFTRLR